MIVFQILLNFDLVKEILKIIPCQIYISGLEFIKKSHTCEEGGAHLRISFWQLSMNLKNK